MRRRMKRRPLVPPVPRWRAMQDSRGQWVVVNEAGEHILLSPDPLIRFESVWLAAKAPELQHALKRMSDRFDRWGHEHSYQHFRDNDYVFIAQGVLRDSMPPWEELCRLAVPSTRAQLEVDFSAFDPKHNDRAA